MAKEIVVVSGASKGIGLAIAKKFSANGYLVLGSARKSATLKEAEATMENFIGFPADMSVREDINAFAAFVLAIGTPVALVNNTGVFKPGGLLTEAEGDFETQIATNIGSAYHLTRALVPAMIAAKNGYVFNMCSTASITPYVNGGSYCISKFGLLGFSKVLREELKPAGIRVTAVLPGAVLTDSWAGTSLPKDRFMAAEDIADVIFSAYTMPKTTVIEEMILRPQLGDI